MNEGWVINQGAFYIKDEAVALAFAKGHGYESLEDMYNTCEEEGNSDGFYWTEWPELDEEGWYESPYEDGREAVYVGE